MGAQINLFCKFTRKLEIGVEEVFVGWSRADELGGGGPYFAPGPGEELIYRLELDAEWVGEE